MVSQIEQFIETMYPKQDPIKLRNEVNAKMTNVPSMEFSETLILTGLVIASILIVGGLMVRDPSIFI